MKVSMNVIYNNRLSKLTTPFPTIRVGVSFFLSLFMFLSCAEEPLPAGAQLSLDPLFSCPDSNHPHKIDMGTGVQFSCCNVGASSPIEYGDYFAWGETAKKSNYSWKSYKWCNGSATSMTKYCNSSSYGTVDNKTELEITDDVARTKMGGSWRMPTIDELSNLSSKCTWILTTINNVVGYLVTSTNGNTLFLPATGYRHGTSFDDGGSGGYYWSTSLVTSSANHACELYFNSNGHYTSFSRNRYYGQSVRPVTE